jgi:heme/copper-type cytochrome/quinol oxidase subunit 4
LECTGDDEIGVVHGNKVSCELAREVVLAVEFVQVYVRVGVFGFLQGMSDGTLQVCTKPLSI